MTGTSALKWLAKPVLEVLPTGPIEGSVEAPSSKSLTNRLLVIAALAEGQSVLSRVLESDDTFAMAAALRALGARIESAATLTTIDGTSGRITASRTLLNAGLSGTTLRFLSAVALLANGTVVLDGEGPLRHRPIAPLLDALAQAGRKSCPMAVGHRFRSRVMAWQAVHFASTPRRAHSSRRRSCSSGHTRTTTSSWR